MSKIEDALRKLGADQRRPAGPLVGRSSALPARTPSPNPLESFKLEAVERVLSIDELALSRWGPVILPRSDNVLRRQEYGRLKRPIVDQVMGRLAAGPVEDANIVLVNSALPSEGKTLTSLNLALSLSREQDLSVLLIDGDVAKADLSRLLRAEDTTGLTDLVADEQMQMSDVVWKTTVPRLFFLPVGRQREDIPELFGSRRMEQVADLLAHGLPNTITVIDSSPLLVTNDARLLAALAGQIIFVVRAGKTSRIAAAEALEQFDPAKPIGLVLNGVSRPETAHYVGYGAEYVEASQTSRPTSDT